MKVITVILGIHFLILSLLLSGCTPRADLTSSAGTIGPTLTASLKKPQHFLVLSALENLRVDIISENIFSYKKMGSEILPKHLLNVQLGNVIVSTLNKNNYYDVALKTLNQPNILNTTNIQTPNGMSPLGSLTAEAKEFLLSTTINTDTNIIILLTQNRPEPLVFDLKCELGKDNRFSQARLEPHLTLYKIYIIDAHSLQILAWITGSPNIELPNTQVCKPISRYSLDDQEYLNEVVIKGFQQVINLDLSRLLKV